MAPTQEDIEQDDVRQRVRDQVRLIREPTREVPGGAAAVVSDTEDDADHNYLFVPGVVLCDDADVGRVNDVLSAHSGDLEVDSLGARLDSVVGDLGVYELMTPSTDFVDVRRFLAALDVLDEELGEGVVTPDHYFHASATGSGRPCPATEPEETGLDHPWPKRSTRADADANIKVTVSVIDTGFWNPAADPNGRSEWLAGAEAPAEGEETFSGQPTQLPEYAGHGTFIAGVVKCRAADAQLQHLRFLVQGGAVRESAMVRNLQLVLDVTPEPHVINLSAGGHTRHGFRPKAFRRIWNDTLKQLEDTVLVAAAGNDGTNDPFYPAAFGWAVGVGSLDNDGDISSFSNYGSSADVYVVGRNHVNAFPHGTYVCVETPDKDDVRVFDRGLARWSGTSFAAPLVAGLVAAQRNVDDSRTVKQIAWSLVHGIQEEQHPLRGAYRRLQQPYD
jgi:hypothetical protein